MPALLLMVKNPIPGKTKTRLAADVGNEMALKMYARLLEWTREQALGLEDEAVRYLFYSNEVTTDDGWPADRFVKGLQYQGDLGERMQAAFNTAFAAGHERVVIIGSDCPGITTDYLREAFSALAENDLVVGPALDGGYTLLGLRKPQPALFTDMEWSTDRVLPTTLARATAAGLRVQQLAPLSDVDHLEDWYSYGWLLPS